MQALAVPLVALALAGAACGSGAGQQNPVSADTGEPLRTLALRVHLLESDVHALGSTLTESEVGGVVSRINEIWSQAGLAWVVESIVREETASDEAFERALVSANPISGAVVASVIPRINLIEGGWDVFLVRDLGSSPPGIYFSSIPAVIVSEIDPAGARDLTGSLGHILAHELGHSLGLSHVACQEPGNLMSPGCVTSNRTRLARDQINTAREQAALGRPFP